MKDEALRFCCLSALLNMFIVEFLLFPQALSRPVQRALQVLKRSLRIAGGYSVNDLTSSGWIYIPWHLRAPNPLLLLSVFPFICLMFFFNLNP